MNIISWCRNCGKESNGKVYIDKLGPHRVCPFCSGSWDVDIPDKKDKKTKGGKVI